MRWASALDVEEATFSTRCERVLGGSSAEPDPRAVVAVPGRHAAVSRTEQSTRLVLDHMQCVLKFLTASDHVPSSKRKGVTTMKNVIMAAINSAFKYSLERVGEILAAAELRRGATDIPGRALERRDFMVRRKTRSWTR